MCMFPACCFRQRTYMAQGLVYGATSMRLELTLVSILNDLRLIRRVLYKDYSPFLLECVYFGLLGKADQSI